MANTWLDPVRDMSVEMLLVIWLAIVLATMLAGVLTVIVFDGARRLVSRWRVQAVERRAERDGRGTTDASEASPNSADVRTADSAGVAEWLGRNVAEGVPASGSPHDRQAGQSARRVA